MNWLQMNWLHSWSAVGGDSQPGLCDSGATGPDHDDITLPGRRSAPSPASGCSVEGEHGSAE